VCNFNQHLLDPKSTDFSFSQLCNWQLICCSFYFFPSFFFWKLKLGNPVLEFATDFNSRAEFFWSHGLISDSTYRIFTSVCNYSRYVSEYYRGSLSPVCDHVMNQVTKETSRFVDKYDVTLDVCLSSVLSQSKILSPQVSVTNLIDILLSKKYCWLHLTNVEPAIINF
jgi:serine carboxypeptidase-like clade II